MKKLFTILGCIAMLYTLDAQILTTLPQVSPKAKVMQKIGLTDVTVVYHRPYVNDRDVWGALVPYDQVWRAGANENTVIHFSGDVEIEGQMLKAGKYGLHMIPGKDNWTVIFSENTGSWGSFTYNPEEDALRVVVDPAESGMHYEMLTYHFEDVDAESAKCILSWEAVSVPFGVSVNTHEVVVASLRDELRTRPGFSWIGWNEAANYCLQNDVNLQEAMTWATRSVFMQPRQQNMITRARLVAKLNGDATKANETILKTMEADLDAYPVTWREYHGLANYALQNLNDTDHALKWLDNSIEMSPNMTNMMTKVGVLNKIGKSEEAEKLKAKALGRGSNAELNAYGYQLLFGGNPAGAVEVFKANTENHPSDPNVWDSLGEGYVNNGQKEEAIKALKKSLSLNPPANVKANSIKLLKQLGVEYKSGT